MLRSGAIAASIQRSREKKPPYLELEDAEVVSWNLARLPSLVCTLAIRLEASPVRELRQGCLKGSYRQWMLIDWHCRQNTGVLANEGSQLPHAEVRSNHCRHRRRQSCGDRYPKPLRLRPSWTRETAQPVPHRRTSPDEADRQDSLLQDGPSEFDSWDRIVAAHSTPWLSS
jgi:hypothetical protein